VTNPLFDFLAANMKDAHATLRAPLDDAAIRAAELKLGRTLPPAFAALYREHDGQEQGRMLTCVFEAYRWLPLAECLDERERLTEVLDEVREDFPEQERWDAAWLPFAADDLGNVWAIDLASGAVFAWDHDSDARPRLGESFDLFVTGYIASFARGERIIDPRLGAMRKHDRDPAPGLRPAHVSRRTRIIGIAVIAAYVIAMAVFVVMLERCRNRRPEPSRTAAPRGVHS
jgi:cell wall assembly regulator SMI1